MSNIDKEIVIEDLEFICDYITEILDRHPEIERDDKSRDIIIKIARRMNDINKRVGA